VAARIAELGGGERHRERVAEIRARFEARTGAFSPEDPWFEERSRAFWCDAVTRERFGRAVEAELPADDRALLAPLERAHRGLFRWHGGSGTSSAGAVTLFDVWSGAELAVTSIDDASRAELEAAADQLFDARVAGADAAVAFLPGAVFHPRSATEPIEAVLAAARSRSLSTDETLDALLRMERTLRALSRVKTAYAYRPEALATPQPLPGARAGRTKKA
jgi:hypothetical protein